MLTRPMDVRSQFPVRKSKAQKKAFREDVQAFLEKQGYAVKTEKGGFGSKNLVVGDADRAKYLITAHYDTCAWMPIPNLITPCSFFFFMLYQLLLLVILFALMGVAGAIMLYLTQDKKLSFIVAYICLWGFLALMMVGPANRHNDNDNTSGVVTLLEIARAIPAAQRDNVCFVLFDLEEAGLLGSNSFSQKHKKTVKEQIVLNLDCVGDGDNILLFPTSKLRKDHEKMKILKSCCGSFGRKTITLREKGFAIYPSDQGNFPYGVGICALHRRKIVGLYLSRIHTGRDRVLEENNVNLLRDNLIRLVSGDAAQKERIIT